MRVQARLIGFPPVRRVRIAVGVVAQDTSPQTSIQLPDGATALDLWEQLVRRVIQIDHSVDKVLIDGQDADLSAPLADGQAIVFFGPCADRQ